MLPLNGCSIDDFSRYRFTGESSAHVFVVVGRLRHRILPERPSRLEQNEGQDIGIVAGRLFVRGDDFFGDDVARWRCDFVQVDLCTVSPAFPSISNLSADLDRQKSQRQGLEALNDTCRRLWRDPCPLVSCRSGRCVEWQNVRLQAFAEPSWRSARSGAASSG